MTFICRSVQQCYRYKSIDFLNIDIEGHELEVLKTVDFSYFAIKVICVEIISNSQNINKRENEIFKFLKKKRYKLKFKLGINHETIKNTRNYLNKLAKKRNMSWDNLWSDLPV